MKFLRALRTSISTDLIRLLRNQDRHSIRRNSTSGTIASVMPRVTEFGH